MSNAAIERVLPNWLKRSGGPKSEAARIFNEKVAPIVGVRVNPGGVAQEIRESTTPTRSVWYLKPVDSNSPLADPRVRVAIDLAIDEAAVDRELVHFPDWPSLKGASKAFDLERAKRLLAESGYPDAIGGLCVVPASIQHGDIAHRIAQLLRSKVGIEAAVNGTSCSSGALVVNDFDAR